MDILHSVRIWIAQSQIHRHRHTARQRSTTLACTFTKCQRKANRPRRCRRPYPNRKIRKTNTISILLLALAKATKLDRLLLKRITFLPFCVLYFPLLSMIFSPPNEFKNLDPLRKRQTITTPNKSRASYARSQMCVAVVFHQPSVCQSCHRIALKARCLDPAWGRRSVSKMPNN